VKLIDLSFTARPSVNLILKKSKGISWYRRWVFTACLGEKPLPLILENDPCRSLALYSHCGRSTLSPRLFATPAAPGCAELSKVICTKEEQDYSVASAWDAFSRSSLTERLLRVHGTGPVVCVPRGPAEDENIATTRRVVSPLGGWGG
jgi:hypothetical protein